MDKQAVLEQIREEAFKDEMEKVASGLSRKTLGSYAKKVSINAAKWKNIESETGFEGMRTLANQAYTRASEALGKIKNMGFGRSGKIINRLSKRIKFSPKEQAHLNTLIPREGGGYKSINDKQFHELATNLSSSIPTGKSMAAPFSTIYMDSMRKIVNPKSTL